MDGWMDLWFQVLLNSIFVPIESKGSIQGVYEQQRFWSDCANAQSDQILCCSYMHQASFLNIAKFIYISLSGLFSWLRHASNFLCTCPIKSLCRGSWVFTICLIPEIYQSESQGAEPSSWSLMFQKKNNLGPGDKIRYIWGLKGPIIIL